MTLEGWTAIMDKIVKVMSPYVVIYFLGIVFIGTYFLVNLTIAVITIKFNEEHNHGFEFDKKDDDKEDITNKVFNLAIFRSIQIIKKKILFNRKG